MRPFLRKPVETDAPVLRPRLFDRNDSVRAGGEGRSRHQAHRLTRGERAREGVAGGDETGPLGKDPLGRYRFRDAYGVAIHRGRVERRPVHVRDDVPRQDPAERLGESNRLLGGGLDRPVENRVRLADRDHRRAILGRVRRATPPEFGYHGEKPFPWKRSSNTAVISR